MAGVGTATVLHADLDAFYASVEQRLDPGLRHRPLAVGGGVVLAASYEARAFGVRAGMAGWRARQLCRDLVFVAGHFDEYQRLGDQVMRVFEAFTPLVERISIDEAFLEVAGAARLFGSPPDIASAIRRRVRAETGLPVSIGVASTKHLAKVASQVAKPDGMVVVAPGEERQFLDHLPVQLLWGVGPATQARLGALGIHTVGDLAAAPGAALEHLLGGAVGSKLASLAVNDDPRQIDTRRRASSMGAQAALGRRVATPALLRTTLGYLADRVGGRLREAGLAGRTVTVRVRFTNLRSVVRAVTLSAPISATLPLAELATELATAALADHPGERAVTLLGMSVANLTGQSSLQLELPLELNDDRYRPGTATGAARFGADRSIDAVRARFGRGAVGYASAVFSHADRVPEAFRELAEHRAPTAHDDETAAH
jgi:DNA polymerase-4